MSWASYLLIHLVIFSWYVFTLSANCSLKSTEIHPGARTFGGRWKYLTFINLVNVLGCWHRGRRKRNVIGMNGTCTVVGKKRQRMLEIGSTSSSAFTSLLIFLWLQDMLDWLIHCFICIASHSVQSGLTITESLFHRFCRPYSSDSLFWLTSSTWYCHPKVWSVVYRSS